MKPKVDDMVLMLDAYKSLPGNGAGGSLHIFTDDGNIGAGHVSFCARHALDNGDVIGYAMATALLFLDEDERNLVYLKLWGRA